MEPAMRISGNTVDLRPVELDDAAFILRLRLDERLNRHISATDADLEAQCEWLRRYKDREREGREYYFIVEGKDGEPCGTLRLYDFQQDSFCWGSWIMLPGNPLGAFESAILAYRCGFENLGFAKSHFSVDKENSRVVAFHKRFGAKVVGEDDASFHFQITRADFEAARQRYERRLK
jgi:RimJ/RimL family protein N-acetyltransferase